MQKTLAPLNRTSETDTSVVPLLRDLFETLFLVLLLYLFLNAFTGRYQVLSVSMEPTLHEGEYLLVNKSRYWLRPVERGDIVVFHPPQVYSQYLGESQDIGLPNWGGRTIWGNLPQIIERIPPQQQEESTPLVKRVVGLPGEHVEARDGRIWIDGVALNEPYVSGPLSYQKTWIVEDDAYVVLGDNRNNSSDSHHWGTLSESHLIGKAILRYWPLEKFGRLLHYDYPRLEETP